MPKSNSSKSPPPSILFLLNELPDAAGLDLFVRLRVLRQLCHRLHMVFQPGQVHCTFQNKMFDKFNVGQLVFQPGQINRTFWVLTPCFRVNPSVDRYFSIKCLSTCKICYPRSSKKARWADSPLKASVCSRLKPRMAWLFTFQNSSFSVFHQTIHCLIVLENRFTSASGTDSKSDMKAALGAFSVKAQIMS